MRLAAEVLDLAHGVGGGVQGHRRHGKPALLEALDELAPYRPGGADDGDAKALAHGEGCLNSATARPKIPAGPPARLFEEAESINFHSPVNRLAHVVYRERRDGRP